MDTEKLLKEYRNQILKAIEHLSYSYAKVQALDSNPSHLTTQELESWEGFVARFARVSDIFLSKYVRSFVFQSSHPCSGPSEKVVSVSIKSSQMQREQGADIRYGHQRGIFHNKFTIVDHKMLESRSDHWLVVCGGGQGAARIVPLSLLFPCLCFR